jgi:hypothetical protein
MDSSPLKRVYFDTNILFRWPHLPNNIRSIFGAAKWVGTELYMPTIVESELEARYVREVEAIYDSIASQWKKLGALCHGVIQVDLSGSRPNIDDLRKGFQASSNQLKTDYGISNIPLTTVTLGAFVDMAINRNAPFEEYEVAPEKKQVVGLQDAAILFSIIDHMKQHRKATVALS